MAREACVGCEHYKSVLGKSIASGGRGNTYQCHSPDLGGSGVRDLGDEMGEYDPKRTVPSAWCPLRKGESKPAAGLSAVIDDDFDAACNVGGDENG